LRQQFERTLGPEYATFLAWLQDLRAPLAQQYPDFTERRARWYTLVDSDILTLLRQGQVDLARQRLADLIAEAPAASAEYKPEVR
jgi:precorrin-2 dehydrogenase/sirohydrochlorin ferrochelatase